MSHLRDILCSWFFRCSARARLQGVSRGLRAWYQTLFFKSLSENAHFPWDVCLTVLWIVTGLELSLWRKRKDCKCAEVRFRVYLLQVNKQTGSTLTHNSDQTTTSCAICCIGRISGIRRCSKARSSESNSRCQILSNCCFHSASPACLARGPAIRSWVSHMPASHESFRKTSRNLHDLRK